MRPRLLLLDEPFVSLDPGHAAPARGASSSASRPRGVTLLLATHDVDLAWALCDERLVLREGRVAGRRRLGLRAAGGGLLAAEPAARTRSSSSCGGGSAATRSARRARTAAGGGGPLVKATIAQYYAGDSLAAPPGPAREVRRRQGARGGALRARLVRRAGRVRRRRGPRLRPERRAGGVVLARLPAAAVARRAHVRRPGRVRPGRAVLQLLVLPPVLARSRAGRPS